MNSNNILKSKNFMSTWSVRTQFIQSSRHHSIDNIIRQHIYKIFKECPAIDIHFIKLKLNE